MVDPAVLAASLAITTRSGATYLATEHRRHKVMHQKVSNAYQELTHYTSASGLKGILEIPCLWASHARFLNDTNITVTGSQ